MISVSRWSPKLDSGEQLRGMADGAERIADFVRNARGEPAERGELELLRLLVDGGHVFQKDQRACVSVLPESREPRHDLGRPGFGAKSGWLPATVPPLPQGLFERGA